MVSFHIAIAIAKVIMCKDLNLLDEREVLRHQQGLGKAICWKNGPH